MMWMGNKSVIGHVSLKGLQSRQPTRIPGGGNAAAQGHSSNAQVRRGDDRNDEKE
jgi:hypothetical protein